MRLRVLVSLLQELVAVLAWRAPCMSTWTVMTTCCVCPSDVLHACLMLGLQTWGYDEETDGTLTGANDAALSQGHCGSVHFNMPAEMR